MTQVTSFETNSDGYDNSVRLGLFMTRPPEGTYLMSSIPDVADVPEDFREALKAWLA